MAIIEKVINWLIAAVRVFWLVLVWLMIATVLIVSLSSCTQLLFGWPPYSPNAGTDDEGWENTYHQGFGPYDGY